MSIPRPEHPQPQCRRDDWENLNGTWQFEIDNSKSGEQRGLASSDTLSGTITVPFCPESKLSGVGCTDFMNSVWYKRTISVPADKLENGRHVLLHIGAADFRTTVFVNNIHIGDHVGGYVSFTMDITKALKAGDNCLTIRCEDDTRSPSQPTGKQCEQYPSYGCFYTRTTGIWQTVWLEYLPAQYIDQFRFYPDAANSTLTICADLQGKGELTADVSFAGQPVGHAVLKNRSGHTTLTIPLNETHLWELGKGNLYDITLGFNEDTVHSYFGLRDIALEGMTFRLNGKSVFQRLVLDQGYYPDGIYTAPSEEALIQDIELSLAAGFNGARLHQKVFEPRFLYHCDRLGYMVWGEYGSWGIDHSNFASLRTFLPDWIAEINRDFNHPSIVGWCPLNETWDYSAQHLRQDNDFVRFLYRATKETDHTRPCIDTSGNYHVETDIFDVHTYEQDPEKLAASFKDIPDDGDFPISHLEDRQFRHSEPVFVSEYGGIGFSFGDDKAWSYGNAPKNTEEFLTRYKALTDILLDNPQIMGFCYTQLTNVEQEQNGLYTYERQPKIDMALIRAINTRKAAIED